MGQPAPPGRLGHSGAIALPVALSRGRHRRRLGASNRPRVFCDAAERSRGGAAASRLPHPRHDLPLQHHLLRHLRRAAPQRWRLRGPGHRAGLRRRGPCAGQPFGLLDDPPERPVCSGHDGCRAGATAGGRRGRHRRRHVAQHQRLSGRHLYARRLCPDLGAHVAQQSLQQGHGRHRSCGQRAGFFARVRRPGAADRWPPACSGSPGRSTWPGSPCWHGTCSSETKNEHSAHLRFALRQHRKNRLRYRRRLGRGIGSLWQRPGAPGR